MLKQVGIDEFTVTIRLETTTSADSAVDVAAEFETLVPLRSGYAWEGTTDITSLLISIEPKPLGPVQWELVLQYGDPDGQSGETKEDENGDQSNDPTAWLPDVEITQSKYEEDQFISKEYMGPAIDNINNGLLVLPVGAQLRAYTNSVNVPYDPPRRMQRTQTHIRVAYWATTYDWDAFEPLWDSINEAPINIDLPGINPNPKVAAVHTMRLDTCGGNWQKINDFFLWRVNVEMTYRPTTWIYSRNSEGADQIDATGLLLEAITGFTGIPLDGLQPIDENGNSPLRPAWTGALTMTWREHEEEDFTIFPFIS